jgi:hypothetical protein
MVWQNGHSNHDWAYGATVGAKSRVHHLAGVDTGPALVALSGRNPQLAAIHVYGQLNGIFATRRELELRGGKRSLPVDILAAFGGKSSDLQGDVALASRVVLEGDRNPAHFTAAYVLDDIRASNAARAAAVLLMASASMFVMSGLRRRRRRRALAAHQARESVDHGLHRRSWIVVEIGISGLHIVHVVRVIHHSHAVGFVAVSVKRFGSAALAFTAMMRVVMLSLHMSPFRRSARPDAAYFTRTRKPLRVCAGAGRGLCAGWPQDSQGSPICKR